MSRPENTTGSLPAQHQMLTTATDFYHQRIDTDSKQSQALLCVQAGQDCEVAINQASMLLGSVNEIMTLLTDDGLETYTIFGLRFMVEASMALMESTVNAVIEAKSQGGVL